MEILVDAFETNVKNHNGCGCHEDTYTDDGGCGCDD